MMRFVQSYARIPFMGLPINGPKWAEVRAIYVRVGTDSKNLFIGQYDKLFEEYWLSPISYLSPYRG